MKLRRFTDAGVAKTREFLAAVKESKFGLPAGRARTLVLPERSEPRKRSLEVCAPSNLHALHVLHG